ncbi:MAG: amidase [Gemmatimonadetes bacterium]|nr:amidase [Gemmatimonadota bacterium]
MMENVRTLNGAADASVVAEQMEVGLQRREMLKILGGLGVGSAVFGRALAARAEDEAMVTKEMIKQAEWVAGLEFTDDERELMLEGMNEALGEYSRLRAVELANDVPPALSFYPSSPLEGGAATGRGAIGMTESAAPQRGSSDEDLAFAPVTELAALLRTRQVSSVELTRICLDRLRRFDPVLKCVISLTEELSLKQAQRADREIAAGRYRGPLHGVPWGAKDLLAVPGYRTTWGAKPYEDQVRTDKSAVVSRLEEAGAVLLAKLSVGALAWGDVWYGGTTKNPWNPEQGSSGCE